MSKANINTINQKIFKDSDFIWIGNIGICQLNEEVNCEIELIATPDTNQYSEYSVSIINRKTGLITKRNISFSEVGLDTYIYIDLISDYWYWKDGKIPAENEIGKYRYKILQYMSFYK